VNGPLSGVRIIELAGLGPAPFGAMMLADMGAEVIRVERVGADNSGIPKGNGVLNRSRRALSVNLKSPDGVELVRRLADGADAFVEGFRPGVVERLGLGPDDLLGRHPRLVYGRMTGWGREGPLASAPSHDINTIALAGALEPIGRRGDVPVPPLSLLGDFAGGGMLFAFGVVCALHEAQRSGRGQVVDLSMVEGAALLMTLFYGFAGYGEWGPRGTNVLDTGAPFYEVYETADGGYVSIASLEPQFYAALRRALDLTDPSWDDQLNPAQWPARKAQLRELFATRTRNEWCAVLEGSDVCFAPVLSLAEAPEHPQNKGTFVDVGGVRQPGPAPRFSRTPPGVPTPPPDAGADTNRVLSDLGLPEDEIARLRAEGVVA
jgi:alpha-methylacyl-CoA racemase